MICSSRFKKLIIRNPRERGPPNKLSESEIYYSITNKGAWNAAPARFHKISERVRKHPAITEFENEYANKPYLGLNCIY